MKRGIVTGKFMPLHKGHIGLVRFALAHCDELIVSVMANASDRIPAEKRFNWVRDEFMRYVKIKVVQTEVPGPDHQTWTSKMNDQFGPFQYVFGSSDLDEALAEVMGATYVTFDPGRTENPVSGEDILNHPFRYWELIATQARGYFVKRICFYGPESTGKSTLAQRMAARYQTEFVPEVAKEFITSNQFTVDDIIRIGHAQQERVQQKTAVANKILFCDTDLITTEIYSDVYLNTVPPVLKLLESKTSYHQYFLFDISVLWVADGLRDLGGKRSEMFQRFRSELDQRSIPFILLSGTYEDRENRVIQFVDSLLAEG